MGKGDVLGGRLPINLLVESGVTLTNFECGKPMLGSEKTQTRDVVKVKRCCRKRSIAIFDFSDDVVNLFPCGSFTESLVDFHPQIGAIDVLLREARLTGVVDLDVSQGTAAIAFEGSNGAFEHLAVEVKAYRGDVPRLLGPQNIASTPDLQVAHR